MVFVSCGINKMDRPHKTRRRCNIKFSKCNAQTPSIFYQIPPTVVEIGQGSIVEMWNRDACLKKKYGINVSLVSMRNIWHLRSTKYGTKTGTSTLLNAGILMNVCFPELQSLAVKNLSS